MSNLNKDHPSIRVFAPPGGRTANIFGVPEPEMPVIAKKNHMESDIFGCKKAEISSSPVKPARTMTNNIFGSDPEQVVQKPSVYSGKNKSTIFDEAPPTQPSTRPDRQRSNIFATEPVQTVQSNRSVSEKFKSNIFGNGDDDNQKRQGTKQGLRVGYNPINGESYGSREDVTTKLEQVTITDDDDKQIQEENNTTEQIEDNSSNNNNNTTEGEGEQIAVDKSTNGQTKNAQHTSVRVHHPPGGRSNGPLW